MDADTLELIDLDALESMWDQEHCQSEHRDKKNTYCSHRVVAITRSCAYKNRRVCGAHAAFVSSAIDRNSTCKQCQEPIADCWSVQWL